MPIFEVELTKKVEEIRTVTVKAHDAAQAESLALHFAELDGRGDSTDHLQGTIVDASGEWEWYDEDYEVSSPATQVEDESLPVLGAKL